MITPKDKARRIAGTLLALISAPSLVHAQVAQAPSPAASTDVVKLNPFEVVDEADNSFTTNSVGSGSRLKLDLREVPVPYSVVNRQFIDALGITDMAEAASWAPGQTFSYNPNGDSKYGEQGTYTVRGFQVTPGGSNISASFATGNQRNFYQTAGTNSDSFAVESYDFGRGPNAALFGTASSAAGGNAQGGSGLSGVSSSQSKRANLQNPATSISVEMGSFGVHRETLDYNRPLTPQLGTRLNLVDSVTPGWRHQNLATTRGIQLTTTWRPTNSTTITLDGLNQKTMTKQTGLIFGEQFSGWDGQTVFRGPVLNSMLSTNAAPGVTSTGGSLILSGAKNPADGTPFAGLTWNGEPQGVSRTTGNLFMFDPNYGTIMNYQNRANTRAADSTSRVPVYSKSAPNGVAFVRGTSPSYGLGGNRYWRDGSGTGLPSDIFNLATSNGRFGNRMPGDRETMALDGPQTFVWTKDLQFALDQSFGSNLFASLGGDISRVHSQTNNDDSMRTAQIDINMLRPDGTPNPHFLDLFTSDVTGGGNPNTGTRLQDQFTQDQAIRANLAYTLKAGRWGNYTFNLNVNESTRHFFGEFQSEVLAQPGTDPRRTLATETVNIISWFSAPRSFTNPLNKTLPFTNVTFDTAGNPTILPTVNATPRLILGGLQNAQTADYWTTYGLLQIGANWLQNRLNFTGAVRRDYTKSFSDQTINIADFPGPVTNPNGTAAVPYLSSTPWDFKTLYYLPVWAGKPADYYNMTYQPLGTDGQPQRFTTGAKNGQIVPKRIATNRPRTNDGAISGLSIRDERYLAGSAYGLQTFQSDFSAPVARKYSNTYTGGLTARPVQWLSPFINFSSQSIPPNSGALDLTGALKKVILAKSVDFGSRFDFGNKFSFKYNYYLSTRVNNAASNNVIGNVNNLINSRNVSDNVGNSNSLGISPLPGNPDYTSTKNFGYEVELSAQPVRGLRVTLNGSAGSTGEDQATRYPLTKAWLLDSGNQSTLLSLLQDAGGALDTTQRPSYNTGANVVSYAPGLAIPAPGTAPTSSFALDQTTAVNAYNNAWVEYDKIVDSIAVTRSRRSPSANFFADYTVQSGMLKNLGIGAGVQWQGSRNAGNKGNWTVVDPTNPNNGIDDPRYNGNDIIWLPGLRNYQANLSYSYRLSNGNSVRLALRVNNPLNLQKVDYNLGLRQPQGDLTKPDRIAVFTSPTRIPDPMNFRLSATYSFGGGARK